MDRRFEIEESELAARFEEVFDAIDEGAEFTITRRGKKVARLVRAEQEKSPSE